MTLDPQKVLADISTLAAAGEITQQQVLDAFGRASSETHAQNTKLGRLKIEEVLYGIGGTVVLAGLVFLVYQVWDTLGPAAQVAVTLGSSLAFYAAGVFLHQDQRAQKVALISFLISAILMPVGIFFVLYHYFPGDNAWLGNMILSGIPAAVFFASSRLFKHYLHLFIGILFSTWFLYALVGYMISDTNYRHLEEVWSYLTLLVGLSYVFIAQGLAQTDKNRIAGPLYFLGSIAGLGAGYVLTFQTDAWYFLYFLLILAAIYLSTILRSRSLLVFGALALISHLIHISFEFFANSLGWPLALIVSGLLIIGVGYGTVTINQKFLKQGPRS